ncbi:MULTISPECIES: 2-oxoacid:acceptor oxidoreductase subunit alpha [unclassified Pseudodesulfovibrio]|uniref:2-oxoacid:acceptor oxidoreductase subunit alpha n=1 Tax=unclassified Pseudodesulfovibrio TaxID=2661612 RepID=UPI000FEB92B6|nr:MULTISPECIES: 2-oxoacid:acceptor oxidoreductase subunit alpha [unclassified Pseudodesulfovibrio]MCJ2163940.1 2-oxoacid:acceptor oxidoreductase subunit alpha [Pseudodesulfovibrio sp. S3-i]RWU05815.1 2-oxoacid:acceptor oxidoreductase subunit alpha [Pseudodesulfovibrio sp. S3]
MTDMSINIVIGGAAGQGLATIGRLLSKGITRAGYHMLVTQKYMSRVRGGHNTFAIRVGTKPISGPCEPVNILAALNEETLKKHSGALAPGGLVVAGDDLDSAGLNALRIPFKALASKPLFYNIVVLGVLGGAICLDLAILESLLKETFAKKGEEVLQGNLEVLRKSFNWVADQKYDITCMAAPENRHGRMMLSGNEAVALGALAAGCNFVSFYPMSPATSVALSLIAKGASLGLQYEQVEDEIAAVNMALGASYAGARAMVTTSGGGFALMEEGVSLAGVSETPLVCVVVQRPGPATGMATRTEQSDLNLVVYAGHGEFPRAVFAPSDPEDCFYLTHRAFDLAETFQTPMFVLSDQYLADSYRDVEVFDLDSLPETARPLLDADDGYMRYALTEDGISPRLVPGFSKALVRADSHEHDEKGKITEDGQNRVVQNSKRLRKESGLFEEVIGPDYYGEEGADVVLLCWGTTLGSCLEAMELAETTKSLAVLHFKQVYPLREEQFLEHLEGADRVISVEGNATAQFAQLIARETGFLVQDRILRYDGRPMTAEYVLKGLEDII